MLYYIYRYNVLINIIIDGIQWYLKGLSIKNERIKLKKLHDIVMRTEHAWKRDIERMISLQKKNIYIGIITIIYLSKSLFVGGGATVWCKQCRLGKKWGQWGKNKWKEKHIFFF